MKEIFPKFSIVPQSHLLAGKELGSFFLVAMSMRTVLAWTVLSPEGGDRALGCEVAHRTLLCGPWAQGQSTAQHHLGGETEFGTGRNLDRHLTGGKALHWSCHRHLH